MYNRIQDTYIESFGHVREEPMVKILKETSTLMIIGISGRCASIAFTIYHAFTIVEVTYQINSVLYGKHNIKWEFNNSEKQSDMIKKIDVGVKNLINKSL